MNTSEILNTAADLIQQRGWTSGEGWDRATNPGAPLCLEGGIMAAAGYEFCCEIVTCPAARAVVDYLGADQCTHEWLAAAHGRPWVWNDASGRTAEQVIEVLRATAVIEAARETETVRESVPA